MKQKIIGTGLSGLVGSRIVELLGHDFEFEDISRKTGTDIADKTAVLARLQNSDAEFVLHLAAYTNVDEAEKEKDFKEQSAAWRINVEGTKHILSACQKTGKHLIHFSTDMVFPGTKELPERYTEEDATGAVGWYATTKEEAEKVIKSAQIPWTILRIAYPYRAHFEKKEYVRMFKQLLEEGREIQTVTDHYFTPTFIDDLANILQLVFNKKLTGIYHAGGKDSISPYDAAMQVAKTFGLPTNLIGKTTRSDYFAGKAPRAFNLSLNSDKIKGLGIPLRSFEDGLEEIKKQIEQ